MKQYKQISYKLVSENRWWVIWPSGIKGFYNGTEESLKEFIDGLGS